MELYEMWQISCEELDTYQSVASGSNNELGEELLLEVD